jgi:hypothetical protein
MLPRKMWLADWIKILKVKLAHAWLDLKVSKGKGYISARGEGSKVPRMGWADWV